MLKELTRHLAFSNSEEGPAEKEIKKDTSIIKVNPEIRKKLPELILLLEGEIKNKWEEVTQKFIISDIQDFAAKVKELGKKYRLEILLNWTKDILTQADYFDMEKLPKTLKYYPKLVEEIKKIAK